MRDTEGALTVFFSPQGQLLGRLHAKLNFLIRTNAEASRHFDPIASARKLSGLFEGFGLRAATHDSDFSTAVMQVENHAAGFKDIGIAGDLAGDPHVGKVHGGPDFGNPHGRNITINGVQVE